MAETWKDWIMSILKNFRKRLKETLKKYLIFRKLDFELLNIIDYSNGSFNKNADGSSEVRYLIF